jgi:hypothetical protein
MHESGFQKTVISPLVYLRPLLTVLSFPINRVPDFISFSYSFCPDGIIIFPFPQQGCNLKIIFVKTVKDLVTATLIIYIFVSGALNINGLKTGDLRVLSAINTTRF